VPVVLCSQGPSDLGEIGHHLLGGKVQDAGWVLLFRQGTLDTERASPILGQQQFDNRAWSNNGCETVRLADARQCRRACSRSCSRAQRG
jgi:hypothetical protein